MDWGECGEPMGGVKFITLLPPSLREAKRRGNPELRKLTLDCRASLAMTGDGILTALGIMAVKTPNHQFRLKYKICQRW
jgi:hypothetical protein